MRRTFLFAKLHSARVTHADIHYEGSIAIDEELLEVSGLLENEQVHVYNVSNAHRFTTYVICANRKSRIIATNGACAHLAKPGDKIIICSYAELEPHEWINFKPRIILLDEQNNFTSKVANKKHTACQSLEPDLI